MICLEKHTAQVLSGDGKCKSDILVIIAFF